VRERLGAPTAEWPHDDGGATWEYTRRPEGTRCWMLTLDARGVLQKIEQALTEENFARIETGWSAERVRRLLGRPASEMEFPLQARSGLGLAHRTGAARTTRLVPCAFQPGRIRHRHLAPRGIARRRMRPA
jgi:hypothetical protein